MTQHETSDAASRPGDAAERETQPQQPETRPRPSMVGALRPVIQVSGFVRKELAEILRQPRLLLVLVAGPFLVLLLFAAGYDQTSTVLRTTFVGPADGVYEEALDQFTDELGAYVTPMGYTTDLVAARRLLEAGETDIIVVFPPDPATTVLEGRQAVINILHDKLDPIQQTAVSVSAHVAVQELNSIVLQELAGQAQTTLASYDENIANASAALEQLEQAVESGDEAAVAVHAGEVDDAAEGLFSVVSASESVTRRLSGDLSADEQERYRGLNESIDGLQQQTGEMSESADDVSLEDVRATREMLQLLDEQGDVATTLDPAIIVRPFASDSENLLRQPVGVTDYFAPGAIALLVQHMVLTFAALGLVSDRARGLFEVFRVGPIGPGRVLLGKYFAYTLIGGAVSAALLASVTLLLGVPMRGSILWVAVGTLGVILASIGLGLVLSLLAQSDTQAVQYAMLVLLAGLFFSGFFLDLDAFRYPVKLASWLLPVTYGVRLLRDVMLRGADPAAADLIGLAVFTAVAALAAWTLLARSLRRI